MRCPWTVSGVVLLTIVASTAHASDLEARAARVAQLRSEVGALNTSVGLEKEELTADLRAAAGQEAELEAAVRRQELRLERLLGDEQAALREIEQQASGSGDDLEAVVRDGITALDRQVDAGLPFRSEDRKKSLADLRAHLDGDTLPTEQVAARVWAFAEDERRLNRENVIGRQVAPVDGNEVLVDVARIGMVAMYFRTPDGQVGQVLREGSGWSWTVLQDASAVAQVHTLFDALEKGIRTGWFTLPAPLSAMGVSP